MASSGVNSIGDLVFSSDENTFTVVPTAGGNPVGYITRFYGGTTCDLKLYSTDAYRAGEI